MILKPLITTLITYASLINKSILKENNFHQRGQILQIM